MGAWIEISVCFRARRYVWSHPTMGAWIEIIHGFGNAISSLGRTPRWVRGLKFINCNINHLITPSHPTMGAWIEIIY